MRGILSLGTFIKGKCGVILDEAVSNCNKSLWDLWLSCYHLAAVAASDTLGIFSLITYEVSTTNQLAQALGIDIPGIEAITCLLASLGLLNKEYNNLALNYTSTQYLLPTSPLYCQRINSQPHYSIIIGKKLAES